MFGGLFGRRGGGARLQPGDYVAPATLSAQVEALDAQKQDIIPAGTFATPLSVEQAVQAIVGMSPVDLNTLAEIASRIVNGESNLAAIASQIAGKQDIISAGTYATPAQLAAAISALTALKQDVIAAGTYATPSDLTGKQDSSAKLAALAALALAADKLIYANGANSLATADLTALGRQVMAAANAPALAALAGLTPSIEAILALDADLVIASSGNAIFRPTKTILANAAYFELDANTAMTLNIKQTGIYEISVHVTVPNGASNARVLIANSALISISPGASTVFGFVNGPILIKVTGANTSVKVQLHNGFADGTAITFKGYTPTTNGLDFTYIKAKRISDLPA